MQRACPLHQRRSHSWANAASFTHVQPNRTAVVLQKLGSPVVPFCPFSFWVPLLKPISRKKCTLISKGLLGNLENLTLTCSGFLKAGKTICMLLTSVPWCCVFPRSVPGCTFASLSLLHLHSCGCLRVHAKKVFSEGTHGDVSHGLRRKPA